MKKKDKKLFDTLVKHVEEMQKKRSDFDKLCRQIECGLCIKKDGHNGHEFKFK